MQVTCHLKSVIEPRPLLQGGDPPYRPSQLESCRDPMRGERCGLDFIDRPLLENRTSSPDCRLSRHVRRLCANALLALGVAPVIRKIANMQLPGMRSEVSLSNILFLAMATCIGSVLAIFFFYRQPDRSQFIGSDRESPRIVVPGRRNRLRTGTALAAAVEICGSCAGS